MSDGGPSESDELDELELALMDGGLSESEELDELEVEKAGELKLDAAELKVRAVWGRGSNMARSRRYTLKARVVSSWRTNMSSRMISSALTVDSFWELGAEMGDANMTEWFERMRLRREFEFGQQVLARKPERNMLCAP